jgi:serine/threonine protein phosphatase PrpC
MDPDAQYEEAIEPLRPGDTLLLFTDGLIERRSDSIVDVLEEFVQTAAAAALASGRDEPGGVGGVSGTAMTAGAQADRILASAVSDTADDACLVAVRIR